jgi:hypothetical protein
LEGDCCETHSIVFFHVASLYGPSDAAQATYFHQKNLNPMLGQLLWYRWYWSPRREIANCINGKQSKYRQNADTSYVYVFELHCLKGRVEEKKKKRAKNFFYEDF